MNSEILTAQGIWKDWDADAPLATVIIKESTDEQNTVKEIYFNGSKKNDGIVRIFGRLTMRKTALKPPCIVIAGEPHKNVGVPEVERALNAGYAVFEFDYGGKHPTEARFTLYPESLSQCNYFSNPSLMSLITPNPYDSPWYEWTAVVRRAVKQAETFAEIDTKRIALLGIGYGAVNVWRVCALEPSLRGGAILLGRDKTEAESGIENNDNLRYLAALSPKNYLTFLNRPVFIEIASNETGGYFDLMSDFINFLPTDNGSLLSVTERSRRTVGQMQTPNLGIWFNTIFSDKQPRIHRPILKAHASQNKLYFELKANNPGLKIESVDFFYAYGNSPPGYRNWTKLKPELSGEGEYIAKAPVFDLDEPFYCYATVKFKDSYSLSTRFVTKRPSQMKINQAEEIGRTRLLYDNSAGLDCFTVGSHEVFATKDSLKIIKGPFDIEAVTALSGKLITNKPCDRRYRAYPESLLQLSLWSKSAGQIKITAVEIDSSGEPVQYSVNIQTVSNIWSKITLNADDFKSDNILYHLESFEDVVQLRITSDENNPAAISGMIWV